MLFSASNIKTISIVQKVLTLRPTAFLPRLYKFSNRRLSITCIDVTISVVSAHEKNISGGRFQVDAEFGYYIANPEQGLPDSEKHLRSFLTS